MDQLQIHGRLECRLPRQGLAIRRAMTHVKEKNAVRLICDSVLTVIF